MSEPLPCIVPPTIPRDHLENLAGPRIWAILLHDEKWPNGTELTYHFLQNPRWEWPEHQKDVVRWAFDTWKALGIGLRFREEPDLYKAELRIGHLAGESFSWVGREVRRHSKADGRNMNFGLDLRTEWGKATALHEIGHALGMPHEHQNPDSGIQWDEAAVYAYYRSLEPPWDDEITFDNVIRKLDPGQVGGSAWDMHSIMHYPMKPGLIARPEELRRDGTPQNVILSDLDKAWVRQWYPPLGDRVSITPGKAQPLVSETGAQKEFRITPRETREYTLRTRGALDTLIALAQEVGGGEVALAMEDDSGSEETAVLAHKLEAGQTYVARVRINYVGDNAAATFLVD